MRGCVFVLQKYYVPSGNPFALANTLLEIYVAYTLLIEMLTHALLEKTLAVPPWFLIYSSVRALDSFARYCSPSCGRLHSTGGDVRSTIMAIRNYNRFRIVIVVFVTFGS